jgi:hypothetical protein
MTGTAGERFLIGLGAPLLMLTAFVLAVWIAAALNDGSSPLTAMLTAALLLMFAIQLALLLAPKF